MTFLHGLHTLLLTTALHRHPKIATVVKAAVAGAVVGAIIGKEAKKP